MKGGFCFSCGTVLCYPCANGGSGTSTGMPQNTAALLSYLGFFVTGLIFYLVEKNRFVRFHAVQSMLTFLPLFVLEVVLGILFGRSGFIAPLIWIGALILWVILMLKANQGETFKLPVVGAIAEKQLK
jgi:uncharacterized membrane protein